MTQQPYPGSPPPYAGYEPTGHQFLSQGPHPVRGLAITATIAAVLLTVVEVVEAAFAWSAQATYLEAADKGESALDVWTAYDIVSAPLGLFSIFAYVAACLWLFRARKNAEILRPGAHHARKSGWVWAGWLVPVVSLWFPFQVVRDIRGVPAHAGGSLLGWWWAFWLISFVSGQVGVRLIGFGEIERGAIQALGAVETVNALLNVVALALWLTLIRNITQDQERAIDAYRQPAASQA